MSDVLVDETEDGTAYSAFWYEMQASFDLRESRVAGFNAGLLAGGETAAQAGIHRDG